MPVNPTYPGVYIEEISSGVRTIVGVSTSVTAFIGSAKRGPINEATHILSFSDFERHFGGLQAESFMSYAVKQFFLNGGTDAWVVRIAKNPQEAIRLVQNDLATDTLKITARNKGISGNQIEVRVNYATNNPASTFNMIINYKSNDNLADNANEKFENLSMNRKDSRYVNNILAASELVSAERIVDITGFNEQGMSISGDLDDVAGLVDVNHTRFQIVINGLHTIPISLNLPADVAGATPTDRLNKLCAQIQLYVRNVVGGNTATTGFICTADDAKRIKMISGQGGENSSVRVLSSNQNDVAARLKLGTLNGGVERDAIAKFRPRETPEPGMLTSDEITLPDPPTIPSAAAKSFQINLDGYGFDLVSLNGGIAAGGNLAERLGDLAKRIEQAVRNLKPGNEIYQNFACTVKDGKQLVLASGSRGFGSSVEVRSASENDIADSLKLLTTSTQQPGSNFMLINGNEESFTAADEYNLYIGNRLEREGIYALEAVDLFNLLCLPGVTDTGILMDADAYCQERRAFMIIDAPESNDKPDEMLNTIKGTGLPKSKSAAVYYPWVKIADPLQSGRIRPFPPSGTIAGLFARTDTLRGVWKAPAGTEANLLGVQALDYVLNDRENGALNPLGVNCIRIFPVYGTVAWGARTTRGADEMTDEYKYIPVRRLALFIEETLYRNTQWVVFEPNDEPLWAQIRLNIGAFMHDLFRQGAFQGKTPREAYFVKCDSESTTQNDIDKGIVNIVVGFAPLKPAEFVIIKLQQMAGQIQA